MSERARNLTDNVIARIVALLDSWNGRLTWKVLIQRVRRLTGYTYTRQALAKRARIQAAFSQAAHRPLGDGHPLSPLIRNRVILDALPAT
jgi:hypothetical protein